MSSDALLASEPDRMIELLQMVRDDMRANHSEVMDRLNQINGRVRKSESDITVLQKQAHFSHECSALAALRERVDALVLESQRRQWSRGWVVLVATVTATLLQLVFSALRAFPGRVP
jgi:hypothetical protein